MQISTRLTNLPRGFNRVRPIRRMCTAWRSLFWQPTDRAVPGVGVEHHFAEHRLVQRDAKRVPHGNWVEETLMRFSSCGMDSLFWRANQDQSANLPADLPAKHATMVPPPATEAAILSLEAICTMLFVSDLLQSAAR